MQKREKPEVSVVLPCRNEEKALDFCLKQIKEVIAKNNLNAEIIVSDSSIDSSPEIAKKNKARLVKHDKEGYGVAYLEGFRHAKGKYFFMADCDGTYDFNEIPNFLKYLREGYDFVIGNRFSKRMEKGAMPFSHKYIGNPLLSWLLRVFFGTKIKDSHSGMRAISKKALEKLNLKTTGMEFASEMIIKAAKKNLKIKEIPIGYYKRRGDSKLRTFSDGWKHLRFMLIYSPLFLFFIPGLIMFLIGIETMLWLYFGSAQILGVRLYYHPMFVSALLLMLGYQLIFFAFFARTYAITHLGEDGKILNKMYKFVTIEKASIFGILLIVFGLIIYALIFVEWIKTGLGALNEIKNSIIALTLITIGIQTVFYSFMLSILGIKER